MPANGTATMYPRLGRRVRTNRLVKSQPPLLLQWTLFLFLLWIPLESLTFGMLTYGTLTIPRLLGFALFALGLYSRRHAFKDLPRAGYCFLGFMGVFFASSLFVPQDLVSPALSLFFTLFQLFAVYWVATSLFCNNEEIVRKSLGAYSLGCFLLAMGGLFNVGGMVEITTERGMERLGVVGLNPNYLAYMLAMSVSILVGLYLTSNSKTFVQKIVKIVIVGLALPQVMMILSSGSRGALVALMLGLCLYLTPLGLTRKKLLAIMGGAIVICGIAYMALQDPVISERLGKTVEGNHQESRHVIFSEAVDMALERPILGWGPKQNEVQLGRQLGVYNKSPHNLYFQVMLQTGIVGGGLLVIGMGLCLYSAWSGRKTWLGLIPAAVMVIVLVVNVAHDFLPRKSTWFAFALASATLTFPSSGGPRRIQRVGRASTV